MDQLIAQIGSYELYFDVTLLVALAGVVWTFARTLSQELYFLLSLRTREIDIELDAQSDIPDEITGLHVLFIRYGNDTYLKELASDREKYHGRLRNQVTRVKIDRDTLGKTPVKVKLRVHKRLGTQFKFFVEVSGDPKPVVDYLGRHESIEKIDIGGRPYRNKEDQQRSRVFFLVNRFDVVKTVDGFENNFIFPV